MPNLATESWAGLIVSQFNPRLRIYTSPFAAGAVALTFSNIISSPLSLTLTFSSAVFATGLSSDPINWIIAGSPPMNVVNVTSTGDSHITLTTTEGKIGSSYSLIIPSGVIRASDGAALVPPYTQSFTGSGVAPTITMIITLKDARKVDVLFSDAVNESDALTHSNYSISPLLTVINVVKISNNRFELITLEAQSPGVTYTVTASNIHDLAGNLI